MMKWNNSTHYNAEELAKMQDEAVHRVRVMQDKAVKSVQMTNVPMGGGGSVAVKESLSPIENIIKSIGIDEERLIIIAVLIVLINEKADLPLILALMYLLI